LRGRDNDLILPCSQKSSSRGAKEGSGDALEKDTAVCWESFGKAAMGPQRREGGPDSALKKNQNTHKPKTQHPKKKNKGGALLREEGGAWHGGGGGGGGGGESTHNNRGGGRYIKEELTPSSQRVKQSPMNSRV